LAQYSSVWEELSVNMLELPWYLTAPLIGTSIVALLVRNIKLVQKRN
jgi:hypothetical protein